MKLRTLLSVFGAAILIIAVSLVSQADPLSESTKRIDQNGIPTVIKSGDYVDLTFLRQLKLATAAYVNPDLYTTAEVAYAYDPKSFAMSPELVEAMKRGEVWVGFTSQNEATIRVYAPTEAEIEKLTSMGGHSESTKSFQDILGAVADTDHLGRGEPILVAKDKALFGQPPSNAVVTWSPKEPVVLPKPKPVPPRDQ